MVAAAPFRTQIGWVLAALVWVVLAMAPGLESAVCADDEAPAAAHQMQTVHAANALGSDPAGHADAPGLCVHGHVHHSAPTLGEGLTLTGRPAYPPPVFALIDLDGQAWRLAGGLERPPRA